MAADRLQEYVFLRNVRGLLINEFLETLEGDYENVLFRDEPEAAPV